MEFEWDPAKSDLCFSGRGFDFTYVIHAFLDPDRLIRRDSRWDYGEDRYLLLGRIDNRVFVVVYTTRDLLIRIISARKANQRELNEYENRSRKT